MPQFINAVGPENGGRPPLLITVHGIRTFGQWQERLEQLVQIEAEGIRTLHYKFGYFSIFAFIIPFLRWLVTRRFRRALLGVLQGNPDTTVDIVAHSFGTHIVGWALWSLRNHPLCRVRTVILAGSVLKPDFPWNTLLDRGVIKNLINECGIRDNVLLLNQVGVLFTGMAGRIGFNGFQNRHFANYYHDFGHSDYFLSEVDPADSFMAQRWVPLIAHDRMPPSVDKRRPSVGEGVFTFVAQNAEPIKVAFYSSPFIVLSAILFVLYSNADEQRRLASSRAKAAEAQVLLVGDDLNVKDAAQLAVEAAQELKETKLALFERRLTTSLGIHLLTQSLPSSNVIYVLRSAVGLLPINRRLQQFPDGYTLNGDDGPPPVMFALRNKQMSTRLTVSSEEDGDDPASGDKPEERTYILDLKTGAMTLAGDGNHEPAQLDKAEYRASSSNGDYYATLEGNTVRVVHRTDHWTKQVGAGIAAGTDLQFSPHDRYLAWRSDVIADGPQEGSLCLWEFRSHARPSCSKQSDSVNAIAFSPDESTIAVALGALPTGSGQYKASIADAALLLSSTSFEVLHTLKHGNRVIGVSFNPQGNRIATSSEDGTVKIWGLNSGRELRRVTESLLISADFLPNGQLLTLSEKEVRVDDVVGESLGEFGDPTQNPSHFTFNHAGTKLAVDYPDDLQIWNVHPLHLEAQLGHRISDSDRASIERYLNLEEVSSYHSFDAFEKPSKRAPGGGRPASEESEAQRRTAVKDRWQELLNATTVGFSDDDSCVVMDRETRPSGRQKLAWSVTTFAPVSSCNASIISSGELSAGTFRIDVNNDDYRAKKISVRSITSNEVVFDTSLGFTSDGEDRIRDRGFGLSGDGSTFASIVDDHHSAVVHNLHTRQERSFHSAHEFTSIAFSSDSRFLALGDIEGTVSILELKSMREVDRFVDPEGVVALHFNSDGHILAVAHENLFTLYELDMQKLVDHACAERVHCSSQ